MYFIRIVIKWVVNIVSIGGIQHSALFIDILESVVFQDKTKIRFCLASTLWATDQ